VSNQVPLTFVAVHVPKCAGSTIERHMLKHLPSEQCWIPKKRFPNLPIKWGRPYTLRGGIPSDPKFVSGHHIGRSVENLFPARSLRLSVLLREPISFMLSYYNFRMMRYLSQGWKPYSFELHLRSLPCDPISHFLLETWLEIPWPTLMVMSPDRKYEILNKELGRFWYVADYTHCDELIDLMGRELGIPTKSERLNTQEQWIKKTSWRPLSPNDLSFDLRCEIAARTRLDRALWESWSQARLNTSRIQPVPLQKSDQFTFLLGEVRRPVYEIERRYRRGWF